MILLHIGTNDFGTTNDYPNAVNRLDTLISWIATNLQQVAVTFSKAVDPASATNLANYSSDGGLTFAAAALSADKRTVTLTTSVQTKDTVYTLTVNKRSSVSSQAATLRVISPATVFKLL